MTKSARSPTPMTRAVRILGVALILGVVAVTVVIKSVARYQESSPFARERRAREQVLASLLESHASRNQTLAALAIPFEEVSNATSNTWVRSQLASLPRLRDAAGRYPQVYFHAGTRTLVWLFFDSDQTLRDAVVREQ